MSSTRLVNARVVLGGAGGGVTSVELGEAACGAATVAPLPFTLTMVREAYVLYFWNC